MSTANDLSAALEVAAAGDEAGSQTATEPTTEAKTEDIVAKAVSEATATKPTESPSEEKASSAKTVPYERFSEVIEQKNAASERLGALEQQFRSATEREDNLRTQLGKLEQEHDVLEAIRDLGRSDDTNISSAVKVIDNALQGIEEEVVEATAAGDDKAVKAAETKFAAKAEELEALVNEQRVESLWKDSKSFANELLASLPEEYTDVDKARLGKMWTPRVDWNAIEEGGAESIPDTLRSTFAEMIKEYKEPIGAIENRIRTEVTESIPEAARPSTPEDVVDNVMGKNWSETNKDGSAVLGDDEFAADVAKLLRATRQS